MNPLPKYNPRQLIDWFTDKVKSTSQKALRRSILSNTDRQQDNTIIGKMYIFKYDPKYKATLPIYDIYPLVFPIEGYNDGFLGLNLHYLSMQERKAVLTTLTKYVTDSNMDQNTKLRMSYSLLSQTKSLASATRPTIKRYLYNHVRSKFIEIPANEWDRAIELPIELFVENK